MGIDQLRVADGSVGPSSILGACPLRQWHDEFTLLNLGSALIELTLLRKFIFLRFHPKNAEQVIRSAMAIAHKFHLPLLLFENL
jgi:hypothetical protein